MRAQVSLAVVKIFTALRAASQVVLHRMKEVAGSYFSLVGDTKSFRRTIRCRELGLFSWRSLFWRAHIFSWPVSDLSRSMLFHHRGVSTAPRLFRFGGTRCRFRVRCHRDGLFQRTFRSRSCPACTLDTSIEPRAALNRLGPIQFASTELADIHHGRMVVGFSSPISELGRSASCRQPPPHIPPRIYLRLPNTVLRCR